MAWSGIARTIRVAPTGADFSTVQAAADVAMPGDEVVIAPGIYREEVRIPRSGGPGRPIVFRGEKNGRAVIRGSERWTNVWKRLPGTAPVWKSLIDKTVLRTDFNPYVLPMSLGGRDKSYPVRPLAVTNGLDTLAPMTLGQIFINGKPMTEVCRASDLKATPDSWMVSYDGTSVWVCRSEMRPDDLVEWSVRGRVFCSARRGVKHIVIDGLAFEHCANQGPFPQVGMVDLRSGSQWTVRNCYMRYAKSIGLSVGSETWVPECLLDVPEGDRRHMLATGNRILENVISDCGVSGIAGWKTKDLEIRGNLVERNGIGDFLHSTSTNVFWEEQAGIKLHCGNAFIAGNIVRDNDACGIWLDTGFDRARITGNAVIGNLRGGIFLESDYGRALVDNNVIAQSRPFTGFYLGDGLYSHNGSLVTVAHNLFLENGGHGINFRTLWGKRQIISRGGAMMDCATVSNRFFNNIFYMNARGALCLAPTNRFSFGTVSEGNLYVEPGARRDFSSLAPFRFCGYNIGGGHKQLYDRVCAVDHESVPSFDVWREQGCPAVARVWKAISGLDASSRILSGVEFKVFSQRLIMNMRLSEDFRKLHVPAVDGIDSDFDGKPYPQAGRPVCPGPFQDWNAFEAGGWHHRSVAPRKWRNAKENGK